MSRQISLVSLADLSAAGILLRPYEAVTIVREVVRQVARGDTAGVPSSHVIRLSSDGTISIEGPVGAGGPSVARAAQLLDSLLPAAGSGSPFRVPGGLRLVIARALGMLDVPPFETLDSFAEALARFASSDPEATVANLVTAWAEFVGSRGPQADVHESSRQAIAQVERFVTPRTLDAPALSELTVSDIRRARRATGLTLAQVSKQCGIPAPLLKQLEWGYVLNWPRGRRGRALLKRYARGAGLDEQLVLSAVAPLLREVDAQAAALVAAPPVALEPAAAEPVVDVEVIHAEPAADARLPRSRAAGALAALAIPALLVIALLPAWWTFASRTNQAAGTPHAAATPSVEQARQEHSAALRPAVPGPKTDSATATSGTNIPAPDGSRAMGADASASRADDAAGDRGSAEDSSERLYRLAMSETYDPSSPPIGTAMFYSDAGDQGASGVMPAGGSSPEAVLRITRIVDDSAHNYNLRFAHDRRHIAFDSDRDGVRGVYVAERDGTNVRRVSAEGFAALPSWSPDGRRLAFVRAEPARPDVWNVWTIDLDSGELRRATRHTSGRPRGASWFPDGRRIAYCHGNRLIVRDIQNGAERVFESPRAGRALRSPAVSPDGRRIIFHVARNGAWLLELPEGSMRRVLEDPTVEEFTWSPDGTRVAYHSRQSDRWGVWVMAPR